MTRAEAIDLCKNLKLFMEINDKLYANKFLESYHVALSMATNALSEVSELQAINLDLASENENLLEQIQEMKAKAWIPVTERLPDKLTDVLIAFDGCPNEYEVAYLRTAINKNGATNEWVSSMGETTYTDYEVSAWMAIQPYKVESEGKE